jgi:N-acetylneuraminate synthase/N,N'-diacetyllegionaminate synthase
VTVRLDDREVGHDKPVFVIAEAGVNHDGDVARAHALVDAAADAGTDAVKFQTFDTDALAAADAPLAEYQAQSGASGTQAAMLRALELPLGAWRELQTHAHERGLLFLSTPFDERSAEALDRIGVPAYKVGSGDLTNTPFLRLLARRGRPMLLSTGMATLAVVATAVEAAAGAPLILLHCVSTYPAPEDEANLRAIATLRETFGVPVGWSDHTRGDAVSLAAVAAGACVIERHVTLDRTLPGPDHAMSLEPAALGHLVRRIRAVEAMLGDGVKRAQPSEADAARAARRSIVAARALEAGETLDAAALAIKRPGGGLPPARFDSLIGARLARPLARDEQLTEAHLA